MTTTSRNFAYTQLHRFQAHIQIPLYRNGYALILSSTTTSGLGLLYWVLAARFYPAEVVGVNSAIISMMLLLAYVAQLNMVNALNRFIPKAGADTGRLIIATYGISATVAMLVSLGYVAGIHIWTPSLGILQSNPAFTFWFVLATMAWAIFVLQDSALTGLRQAVWVPLENTIFALVKIALLLALFLFWGDYALFASWTFPLFFLLIWINILIFRRLIPIHIKATHQFSKPIVVRDIIRFVAGDYVSSMSWTLMAAILPLMVLEIRGPAANAYFYLAWTIAYSLYLISRNMGMSLITEAAADQTKLAYFSYRAFLQAGRLVVPAVALTVVFAPLGLRLFGHTYATEATLLLQLLALSALPNMVINIYVSIARVQRRMKAMILVLAVPSAIITILSYILLVSYGIVGVGVALLLTQLVVATYLLIFELGPIWLPHIDLAIAHKIVAKVRSARGQFSAQKRMRQLETLITTVLWENNMISTQHPTTKWQIQTLDSTVNDITVSMLNETNILPAAVVKTAKTQAGARSLERQANTLRCLQAEARLSDWYKLMPTLLAWGNVDNQTCLIETRLAGTNGKHLINETELNPKLLSDAALLISEFHQRTATLTIIDERLCQLWVEDRLNDIRQIKAVTWRQVDRDVCLDKLNDELHKALLGQTLPVGWVHGDYTLENILFDPQTGFIIGIVDWELAAPNDLPQLDLVMLLLSTRMLQNHCQWDGVVQQLVTDADWQSAEKIILRQGNLILQSQALPWRTAIILCWLRHVQANLVKSQRYATNNLWIAKNVDTVLQILTEQEA